MRIACAKCESVLTAELSLACDTFQPTEEDGEPFVPEAVAYREDGKFWTQFVGQVCVNRFSVQGLKTTSDKSRLNGCCDLDGCDGPNQLCGNCNTEVATAMFDCWMPHCVIFHPEATREVAKQGANPDAADGGVG